MSEDQRVRNFVQQSYSKSALETLHENLDRLKRQFLAGKISFWEYQHRVGPIREAIRDHQEEVL